MNIQDSEFELEDFSQDANVVLLHKHLNRRFPGATFKRWLREQGMDCRVVNAADVATSDKEKRQKNNKIDARKLCNHLQNKKASGIYIPEIHWKHSRSLVRTRSRIVSNQTRCKNRIWQLLHFSGLALLQDHEAGQYWSKHFIKNCRL